MAVQFACPWCTQTISVDDSKAHERVECPYCNLAVKVPTKSTPDLPPPLPLPSQNMENPQPVGVGGSFHAMPQVVEFIFPKRIHRLSFLVRSLATNLLLFWLMVALSSAHVITPIPVAGEPSEDWYYYVALLALGIYSLLFVWLPRVRDIGMSGWWVLLSLFPVVNGFFYLFLIFRAPEYHFEPVDEANSPDTK
jgi:uncharacterized membrane protein YhaH (DUF805 family)